MTLKQVATWLETKSIEEKITFCELFLSEMIYLHRSIGDGPGSEIPERFEALKWSNELTHRIWNLIYRLRSGEDEHSEQRFAEEIVFYAKQSKILSGHLPSTINSAMNRFDHLKKGK